MLILLAFPPHSPPPPPPPSPPPPHPSPSPPPSPPPLPPPEGGFLFSGEVTRWNCHPRAWRLLASATTLSGVSLTKSADTEWGKAINDRKIVRNIGMAAK
eukprot:9476524-Pyramimonas_sp.AAC.3